jgi:hypothetical protein
MSIRSLAIAMTLLCSVSAFGQTQNPVPASPITPGNTWTAGQWLSAWGSKQDVGGLASTLFATPASSSATCTQGQIEFDAAYIYTCVAANTWRRAATTSF